MPHFIDLSVSFLKDSKVASFTSNLKWFNQQPNCNLKWFSDLETVKYWDLTGKNLKGKLS